MEIVGTDGSKTVLQSSSNSAWGRGSGFKTDDRTVSRRHLELRLNLSGEPTAQFRVLGTNPIWVHRRNSGKVSTFKATESGEMGIGDTFCVSAKNPVWFSFKKAELGARRMEDPNRELGFEGVKLAESFEVKGVDALEPESVDISHIDPVKEFGFLVIGNEFVSKPKKMIKDMKNWSWFLEEAAGEDGEESDELEESKRRKKGAKRKRKTDGENDEEEDEDWTGESEGEKELVLKGTKIQAPKYSTRSKDRDKLSKVVGKSSSSRQKDECVDEESEDEDDETLGGFIVNNELEEEEEKEEVEGEEEELDD